MKSEELRIGNWVYFTDFPIKQNPIQITLNEFKIDDFEKWLRYFITPIPLTEEWSKNNIDDSPEVKEWKGNGYDYQPETSKTKQVLFYIKEDVWLVFEYFSYRKNIDSKWITDKTIHIEYYGCTISLTRYMVHTFQNLVFALTGEELKINESIEVN